MVFGAVMGLIWFLLILTTNEEIRSQFGDGQGTHIACSRSMVRALLKFILTGSRFTQHLDYVGACTYISCQVHSSHGFLQCSSEPSSLWENTVCIKILCFFRLSKLLGHSCVGVMDLQDHCAVVTLVVSNCLKKLMSHSCPCCPLQCCGKPVPEQVPARVACREQPVVKQLVGRYICEETRVHLYLLCNILSQSLILCCTNIEVYQVNGHRRNRQIRLRVRSTSPSSEGDLSI